MILTRRSEWKTTRNSVELMSCLLYFSFHISVIIVQRENRENDMTCPFHEPEVHAKKFDLFAIAVFMVLSSRSSTSIFRVPKTGNEFSIIVNLADAHPSMPSWFQDTSKCVYMVDDIYILIISTKTNKLAITKMNWIRPCLLR